MSLTGPDWSIAVFARNEAASLLACLSAIERAVGDRAAQVEVLLNGCTDNSAALVRAFAKGRAVPVRIWQIDFADKSNAWNQYIHAIRPAARVHFFVDAYAQVWPNALEALQAALDEQPEALAAAAVPSCGRSAAATRAAMLASPALHGSLHALRGEVVDRIRQAGLWLPVGLYRGDGLIGSLVMHDLDAQANAWDPSRIVVAPDASWTVQPLSPLRPADLRRWWNRRIQQARGRMEDAALHEVIYGEGFGSLPASADSMLRCWLARHPTAVPTDRFTGKALARLRQRRAPAAADLIASRYPPAPKPGLRPSLRQAVPCA